MNNHITANTLQRVYQVKSWNWVWTWFTIEKNNIQYLITAKHIYKWEIEVLINNEFVKLDSLPIFPDNSDVDIVAFNLNNHISPTLDVWIWTKGVIYGQDVFFLWYPFWTRDWSNTIIWNTFVPFIKKWVLSAINNSKWYWILFIDWHNNKWFSGWPIIFNDKNNKPCIWWIISGYKYDLDETKLKKWHYENSGIFFWYWIESIYDKL